MNEGALTLAADGTILYCNARFAEMIKIPIERIIGRSISRFVARADKQKLASLIEESQKDRLTAEISLKPKGTFVPSFFSLFLTDGCKHQQGGLDLTGYRRPGGKSGRGPLMERERLLSPINTNVSDLIWHGRRAQECYRCVAVSGSYITVTGSARTAVNKRQGNLAGSAFSLRFGQVSRGNSSRSNHRIRRKRRRSGRTHRS
jgi:PAS domain-containing protein